MMSLPVWRPGPMLFLGASVSDPMFLPGSLCPGEGSVKETPSRMVKSAGYAFYWNAFLWNRMNSLDCYSQV